MSGEADKRLICQTRETYGETYAADLFAQYKLYVDSAQQISAARVTSNNFLLTVNAFLVTLNGFQATTPNQGWRAAFIPLAGILVSLTWFFIITSYKNLNFTKFKVIHELEEYLPAALFRYEQQKLECGSGAVYKSLSTLERWGPYYLYCLVFRADNRRCMQWRDNSTRLNNLRPGSYFCPPPPAPLQVPPAAPASAAASHFAAWASSISHIDFRDE